MRNFKLSFMSKQRGGSYIDGIDDLWRWMRDEGDGGEERVSLLFLQLFVLY